MDKKEILLVAATITGLYLIFRGMKKVTPSKSGEEFKNAIGDIFKKKTMSQRAEQTRCETNLERLGRLFPENDQYNAELGKAYQQQGANFAAWAQSTAKPCFVVGADQGGLQSGLKGVNFGPRISSSGKLAKSTTNDYGNFIGSDGQGKYFNADGRMSLDNIVRSYKKP